MRPDEVHAILDRIEPTLLRLDLSIAYMAPDVAARALRRGLPLDLKLTHQQWAIAADVLNRLHNFEPSLAFEVARANADAMAVGLLPRIGLIRGKGFANGSPFAISRLPRSWTK